MSVNAKATNGDNKGSISSKYLNSSPYKELDIKSAYQSEKLIISGSECSSIPLPPSVKFVLTEDDSSLNQTITESQQKMVKKERLRRIIEHDIEFKKLIIQKANLMRVKYQHCQSSLKEAKAAWNKNVSTRVVEKLKEFSGFCYQSEPMKKENQTIDISK